MTYYFSKTLACAFDEAIKRATEALKTEGFGVLTEIDMAATLKSKIGADVAPYRILGACNPKLAYEALRAEDKIGLMLPCNVIVRDAGGGKVEVAAIDPIASMQAIDNPRLHEAAAHVQGLLKKAIATL
ncbi:MAG: DUF302 domain-containing protein [Hyphomicrobiales bacterium]|nr:DUF302 domain-containing protein [Hyphomicrobiales bacterium]